MKKYDFDIVDFLVNVCIYLGCCALVVLAFASMCRASFVEDDILVMPACEDVEIIEYEVSEVNSIEEIVIEDVEEAETPVEKAAETMDIMQEVIVSVETEVEDVDEIEEIEQPKLYTQEDAVALAKMVWGEARGVDTLEVNGRLVSSESQMAATIWTALNRYDAGFEDSIYEVVTAKYQYTGYRESNPVDDSLLELTYDVLDRWNAEQYGAVDVGRVLPSEYMWFHGDGDYNYFRDSFKNGDRWTWETVDTYAM